MQSLDQPLDTLIQNKRKQRQPRRQRGSRPESAKQAAGVAAPAQPKVTAAQASAAQVHVGDKIIVSNLPDDVNEAQIKALFVDTVGPVKSVNLSYNAQGKSKGIATILFSRAESATKAYTSYNKRLIDGKRPMKVEIIVDPSRASRAPTGPAASLTDRLAPAPRASATVAAASGSAQQPRAPRQPGQGRRGGGGGRRGGRGPRAPERPAATVESLDQEMSDWQNSVQSNGAAAATEGGDAATA